jgi:putative spermidine/putrescine transport system permease protein
VTERKNLAAISYNSKIDWARITLYTICGLIAVYLILPILIVFPMSISSAEFLTFPPPGYSLKWFKRYFSDPSWLQPTYMSLQVAILTTVLSSVLGTLAAISLVRTRFWGKSLANSLILAPMIIPVIIISIALYGFFSRIGLLGSRVGLVFGHTMVCVPFVVITVSASLKGFDESLEMAAMICGATRLKAFMKVTLPIIRPGMISGALFAFIISFDEIVISMFLCGIETRTLPLKMWEGIRMEVNPIIAAVSTLLICLSIVLLLSAELVRRKAQKKLK